MSMLRKRKLDTTSPSILIESQSNDLSENSLEVINEHLDLVFAETRRKVRSESTWTRYARQIANISRDICMANDLPEGTELKDLPTLEVQRWITRNSYHQGGTKKGLMKAHSTIEGYRSALVHYYNQVGETLPDFFEDTLKEYIKGYDKQLGAARREGTYKKEGGREHLLFCDYVSLAAAAIKERVVSIHTLLVLCWNLTARMDTALHATYNCIFWNGDHLKIEIPDSKSSEGYSTRGAYNENQLCVYANPTKPEICIFVALGIHILCATSFSETLFRQRSLKTTFSTWLDKIDHDGRNIGGHSWRKGSLSFSLLCVGAVAAITSILRGGWVIPGVLPRYIRKLLEGDQQVGRKVSGLPSHSIDFTLLPAQFRPDINLPWSDVIPNYERYPYCFQECIPFLVAAVVYHFDYLNEILEFQPNHPLILSPLWTKSGVLKIFQSALLPPTHMERAETEMRASGLTDLVVVQYNQFITMEQQQKRITELEIEKRLLEQEVKILKEQRQMPLSGTNQQYRSVFQTTPPQWAQEITQIVSKSQAILEKGYHNQAKDNEEGSNSVHALQFLRCAPEKHSIDWPINVTVKSLSKLWYFGNERLRLGPYRSFTNSQCKPVEQLSKCRSAANKCIAELEKYLNRSNFLSAASNDQDKILDMALTRWAEALESKHRGKRDKHDFKRRLEENTYRSVYDNLVSRCK